MAIVALYCLLSWLAAAAAVAAPATTTSLYRPFVDRALTLFSEGGHSLRPYPHLDDSLKAAEALTGPKSNQQHIALTTSAYCTDVLRQARIVLIEGGGSLQVLNFCIFPELSHGLPTFAADLVTLPGGHLIALDFAPNGATDGSPYYADDGPLAAAFARHREALPDGGALPEEATQYFSPYFLWSRLPKDDSETVSSTVLAAFEDYLRTYLELVAEATPLDNAAALGGVREAQLSYARYRAESDPARPMLTRLFGGEFAERLIREVLFDLPLRLDEEHSSSAAHGAADTRWRRSYDGRAA